MEGWRATGGEGEAPVCSSRACGTNVDDLPKADEALEARRGDTGAGGATSLASDSGGGDIGAPAFWLHLCRRTKVETYAISVFLSVFTRSKPFFAAEISRA